jgi:hypothetical protein
MIERVAIAPLRRRPPAPDSAGRRFPPRFVRAGDFCQCPDCEEPMGSIILDWIKG